MSLPEPPSTALLHNIHHFRPLFFQIAWSATNQDAADLNGVFYRNDLLVDEKNTGIMRLVAKNPGRVVISVRARISSSLPMSDQYQLERDREYTDTLEVQIFDDLSLRRPILPSNTLLISPESEYQLKTNREAVGDVSYTVLSSGNRGDVVSVSKSGLVKAGRGTGSSIILIEDQEDFGIVQRMSVIVEVKPINYMMLNVMEAFTPMPHSQLSHLPKGFTLPVETSYHDNTGMRFDVTNSETGYRPNRFDTILLKDNANDTFTTELIREEYTVLRTYSGLTGRDELQDFVIMNVRKAITPDIRRSDIIVGDVIDLDNLVQGLSKDASKGFWTSEPKGMVTIDKTTGMATTLRVGQSRVSYFINNIQRTSMDLDVKQSSRIQIQGTSLDHLTRTKEPQFVPFLIQSETGNETGNFHGELKPVAKGSPSAEESSSLFECRARFSSDKLQLSEFFTVQAVFSHVHRTYACKFTAKDKLFHTSSAVIADNIDLKVFPIYASHLEVRTDSAKIQFVPGFHVPTESLLMTNAEPSDKISIQGLLSVLNSLRIEVSNDQFLQVGTDYLDGDTKKVVPVHLRSAYWSEGKPSDELTITLTSTLTSQKVTIPVSVTFSGDFCPNSELGWTSLIYFLLAHYQTLVFMIITCIIVYLLTYAFLTRKTSSSSVSSSRAPSSSMSMKPLGSPLLGSPQQSRSGLSSSPLNMTNSENKPYLFTADNAPIYGSPSFGRKSPRSLTSYSYTDQ